MTKGAATAQKLPDTGSDTSGAIGAATLLLLAGGAAVAMRARGRRSDS
ncbi:LPXTG cell wall anchor domain-containing protein [Actinotignum sanguinis]